MDRKYSLPIMLLLAILAFAGLIYFEAKPAAPVVADLEPVGQEPEPDLITEVTLAAVGDIMAHMPQVNAAYNQELGVYDFSPCFAPVRPLLEEADIAVANLETTLTGSDRNFSGYPRFNSPAELAQALKWTGFDLICTANNHSLDRGEEGVLRTLANLNVEGLAAVGTYSNWEERKEILVMEEGGQRLAFLAYTYGTNGLLPPAGKEYLVKLIDEQEMGEDIAHARAEGVDWIIVFLHFGNEYQRTPSPEQEELVDYLITLGVDVILGSHPHVLQPVIVTSGSETDQVVAYSLGNFVSNQRDRYRDSGMILYMTLEKNLTRDIKTVSKVEYVPTWVHRYQREGRLQYQILPVESALRDYEQGNASYLTSGDYQRLQEVWEETTQWVAPPEGKINLRNLTT